MEQFDLNFENAKDPERMTVSELKEEYLRLVGVPARTEVAALLIAAIKSPEQEISRLREEDRDEDKNDILKTYRR